MESVLRRVRGEVNLMDSLYCVMQVCSITSSAMCGDTTYKVRLFSQHHDGQGWRCAGSCRSAGMLKLSPIE